jgi:hypothetical protein
MRAPQLIAATAALLAICACHGSSGPTAHVRLRPPRAASLWVQTVADGSSVTRTRLCLDAGGLARLADLGARIAAPCTRRGLARTGIHRWRFATECPAASGETLTSGEIRGDFARQYLVAAETRTADGAVGRLRAEVRRIGPCPPTLEAGEVVLPGGRRTTLAALEGRA